MLGKRNIMVTLTRALYGCKQESLTIRYLGVPLRPDRVTRGNWALILDNLERRLEG